VLLVGGEHTLLGLEDLQFHVRFLFQLLIIVQIDDVLRIGESLRLPLKEVPVENIEVVVSGDKDGSFFKRAEGPRVSFQDPFL